MNGRKHSYVMVALVLVGGALFLGGAGGVLFLLWPLACVGMMLAMMRSMSNPPPHNHPGGGTHSHNDLTPSGR